MKIAKKFKEELKLANLEKEEWPSLEYHNFDISTTELAVEIDLM